MIMGRGSANSLIHSMRPVGSAASSVTVDQTAKLGFHLLHDGRRQPSCDHLALPGVVGWIGGGQHRAAARLDILGPDTAESGRARVDPVMQEPPALAREHGRLGHHLMDQVHPGDQKGRRARQLVHGVELAQLRVIPVGVLDHLGIEERIDRHHLVLRGRWTGIFVRYTEMRASTKRSKPPATPGGHFVEPRLAIPDAWSSGVVERPGVRLHYTRTGTERPAVVLLHGAMDNGLCFISLAKVLEPLFDVVMPDARGHGTTEVDRPGFSLSDMVDDTAVLIEQLDLARAIVIGHSMGAQMATDLGARYPELVDRIVLEDPAFRMSVDDGPRAFMFTTGMRLGSIWMSHGSPEQIRRLANLAFKKWCDEDKDAWALAQYQSSRQSVTKSLANAFDRDRDWTVDLRKIEAPTLLITSDKGLIKDDEATEIMAALRNGSRAHIAHAGHNVRRDNTPDYLAAVTSFLSLDEPGKKD